MANPPVLAFLLFGCGGEPGARDTGLPDLDASLEDRTHGRDLNQDYYRDVPQDTIDANLDAFRCDAFVCGDARVEHDTGLQELLRDFLGDVWPDRGRDRLAERGTEVGIGEMGGEVVDAGAQDLPGDEVVASEAQDAPTDETELPDIPAGEATAVGEPPDAPVAEVATDETRDVLSDEISDTLDGGTDAAGSDVQDGGVEGFPDVRDGGLDASEIADAPDGGVDVREAMVDTPVREAVDAPAHEAADAPIRETPSDTRDAPLPEPPAAERDTLPPEPPPVDTRERSPDATDALLVETSPPDSRDGGTDTPAYEAVHEAPPVDARDGGVDVPAHESPVLDTRDAPLPEPPRDAHDAPSLEPPIDAPAPEPSVETPTHEPSIDAPAYEAPTVDASDRGVDVGVERDASLHDILRELLGDAFVDFVPIADAPTETGRPDAGPDVPLAEAGLPDAVPDVPPTETGVPDTVTDAAPAEVVAPDAGVDVPIIEIGTPDVGLDAPITEIGVPDVGRDTIDARDAARPGIVTLRNIIEGEIVDMEPVVPDGSLGAFWILARDPTRLWRCVHSSGTIPTCSISAEFRTPESGYTAPLLSTGMYPVDYAPSDRGAGIVNFTTPIGTPTIVAEIDEAVSDPTRAVLAWESVTRVRVPPSIEIPVSHPGGVATAYVNTPAPPHPRYFMAMNMGFTSCGFGMVPTYSDQYGIPMLIGAAGFLTGYNTVAIRRLSFTMGGRNNFLAVVSTGCGGIDSRIELRNTESAELVPAALPIVLSGVAVLQPNMVINPTSQNLVYVANSSTKVIRVADLAGRVVTDIDLSLTGTSSVRHWVWGLGALYFTDNERRLTKVIIDTRRPYGSIRLEDGAEPNVLMWMGSNIYAGYEDNLQLIDPAIALYERLY